MANSVDPEKFYVIWSGSTLFAHSSVCYIVQSISLVDLFFLYSVCNCEGTREAMHYHVIKGLTAVADRCLLEHRISFNRMCVQR